MVLPFRDSPAMLSHPITRRQFLASVVAPVVVVATPPRPLPPVSWTCPMHLEAAYPAPSQVRLYVYDEYSRPFIPKGFASRIVADNGSIPFKPAPGRGFLEARLPQAALPAKIVVKARFEPSQPEYHFDFQF